MQSENFYDSITKEGNIEITARNVFQFFRNNQAFIAIRWRNNDLILVNFPINNAS